MRPSDNKDYVNSIDAQRALIRPTRKSRIRDKREWSKLHRALVGGTLVMVGACFLVACSDDNGAPAASADAAEQDHGSAPADDVASEHDDGTATADDMAGAQDSSEADASLLSFVNDADCELKCKGDYCMVVCPDGSGGQGGWKLTTSLTRHRRAEYPFTAAHSHQVNHAPI